MLAGNKIVLRPFQAEDAELVYQATLDPVLRRLTGTQNTFTLEQVQAYVARYANNPEDRVGFIIAERETLKAVGEIVLLNIDPDNRSANIRIGLFRVADLDQGYGSEAMRLMVDYGFRTLKLHRIGLDVLDFNTRAVHVYEKIGFKQEGMLRDTLFYEGAYHSEILMGILESEWLR